MKKTAIALCLIGLLTACGEKAATEKPTSEAPKDSKPQASASKPTGANSDAAAAFNAAQQKAEPKKPMPDLNVPLENYTAIQQDKDKGATWLTYLAVAQGEKKAEDKELLDLFSAKYYNEADAFKKQELASTELPPIKELVAAYSKQRYYSLDFGQSNDGISPSLSMSQGYDFDTKSFKVGGGQNCFNMSYNNRQSVNFTFAEVSPPVCNIKIEDIEMAKQVEQLRAANHANLRGKIYFFVQGVENGNQVKVIPTHVRYDVYDKPFYIAGGKQITTVTQKAALPL